MWVNKVENMVKTNETQSFKESPWKIRILFKRMIKHVR